MHWKTGFDVPSASDLAAPPVHGDAQAVGGPDAVPVRQVSAGLRALQPNCFGLVMATGILSLACQYFAFEMLAKVLFGLNGVFFVALGALVLLRLVRYPQATLADLVDHDRGVGYYTWVAGTCVLAVQCVRVYPLPGLALVLGVMGAALWIGLSYAVFAGLTLLRQKPKLERGLNGGWLLMVVATQSLSLACAELGRAFGLGDRLLFPALLLWLSGSMFYIWVTSLIFYRYTFFVMTPARTTPSYWINMGAAAISCFAGTVLISAAPESDLLLELLPFLKGMTLFAWAVATWWIPMLVILGLWRHVYRRFPLKYDVLYWSAVFPLGMYSAGTWKLGQMVQMPLLQSVAGVFLVTGLAGWLATFTGLARGLAGGGQRQRDSAFAHRPWR